MARKFGIDKREGLLVTFFTNDWMHCIFENPASGQNLKKLASCIIAAEMTLATIALMYYQSSEVSITVIFPPFFVITRPKPSRWCPSTASSSQ